MLIGGLDIGTTGCKLTIYGDNGNYIYNSYKEYTAIRKSGKHEIDGGEIYKAVLYVISDTVSKYINIKAICVTSFGETFVTVDKEKNVLLPSMLYTDPRGKNECSILCEKLGKDRITEICGVKPNQMFSLPKVMWIKNNLPDVYKNIDKILLIEDYIIYKLTGNAVIDYSLAARTLAFDIRKKEWSKEILNAADVDKSLFSDVVPTGNVAGVINKGMPGEGITIVNGCHDQVAAAIGSGVFDVGQAVDGAGTVECVTPVFDHIPQNKEMFEKGYCVVPYVFDGKYVSYAFSFTGGAAIKWYKDNFKNECTYPELEEKIPAEPTNILVLPHFAGAATPYMDNYSKAAFLGVTLENNSYDMYKAIMEGVSYEMQINISNFKKYGIEISKLYAAGGGASSDKWLQIKADVLNIPIIALMTKEAGTCGSCMLAAMAAGICKDLYEAKKVFIKERKCFIPNKENIIIYNKMYGAYKKIYKNIRPIIKEAQK